MKTTREFQIAGESGTFRIAHHSADWRQDVGTGSAIVEVQKRNGTWLDFMVIRSEDEIARIEKALRSTPITTVTPVDAGFDRIFARHFPDGAHHAIEPSIKAAIAEAFAAGRDFEGTRRDRRAQRDEKTERKAKIRCAHCGEEGERAGHQGCQYPQEIA